ncbi:glycosyltransferase family 4 protein [Pelagovum pacificum]|uniref:Glycosyltransferase family 4 protein n=1 Tax=Pelagovum pacificum TaxID=2588711 RepID=A0A5C5GDK8_9RHOB|nr:glycosyltransferase family 4 protein [Pelagovum pacificum]QQA44844.1 glycosyltransferase family 4 protein [Pelagovum pacificum]TNY32051.1 glycosyltransferase family 4 protein [Pelagovum pacificum]
MPKPGLLICLTYHLPNVSGLTLSAHALALHLAGRGYPVRIATARHPADLPAREEVEGLEVHRSRALAIVAKAAVMPGYAATVWRALDDMSAVNLYLPNLDAAVVAIVARLRGRRLIVTYACSVSRRTLFDRFSRLVAASTHLVAGLLADRIHVVSEDYAAQSTFCRLFRRKLDFAPYAVPLPLGPDEPARPTPPDDVAVIGFVGRISRQKSLELLLDAIPDVADRLGRDVRLDLIGPAEGVIGESYWPGIKLRIEESGGRMRYRGVLRGEALAAAYRELDVLVLPSADRLESYGLVQVEAMLRGVPVVASDRPGVRLPVQETGMGELFSSGDVGALVEALVKVLADPGRYCCDSSQVEARLGNAVAARPYVSLLEAIEAESGR